MTDLEAHLHEILSDKGWINGKDAGPWQRDWLNRYGEVPLGVARPSCTHEVSLVLRACHAAGVPVVAQGGNTSLCGGAVAGSCGGVILSLTRMAAMSDPEPSSVSIEVESGLVLQSLHERLDGSGFVFPLHLGAEGSAQIGGLIATNAGGSQAFRFGMIQDLVLGLEVVLADGTVWNGLRSVLKDNAGYQLRRLFCGSEGTLGIVTRAILRLSPAPKQRAAAFLALPNAEAAMTVGARLRREAGEFLTGLEFFSDLGVELALRHIDTLKWPLETRQPTYLLIEMASGSNRVPLEEILVETLEWAMAEELVVDGAIAASEEQRVAFWRWREEQPEGQRLDGAQLKHDISVPPERIDAFIDRGSALCERLLPGVRINPFGHLGDGNIHYNLSPPEGMQDFAGQQEALGLALARLASELGGSFAAEHGLGRSKVALADTLRDKSEREIMAAIKHAFDPAAILNPGVLTTGRSTS